MVARGSLLTRRAILLRAAAAGTLAALSPAERALAEEFLRRTPHQILGPYYPPAAAIPSQTGDLTQVAGRPGRAQGQVLHVMGRVLSRTGEPARGVTILVWQANIFGRYIHPNDANPAPLDPNFEGFASLTTDENGGYRFKTIKPPAYPVGPNTMRPAHIHFEIRGKIDRLITQMYFDGDPYNATDPDLQSASRKDLLITKMEPSPELEPGSNKVLFNIVMTKG